MSRSRKIVIGVAVLAMLALPLSNVLANHYFEDVPTSAFYHNSVTAIANAEITAGCNAAQTKYCPNNAVTRGQMAVFLDRVANLRDENGPVVDAWSLFGQTIFNNTETFSVAGTVGTTECFESEFPLPPASVLEYVVTAQLTNAPVETSTINASVDDGDLEDGVFDVCFTLIGAGTDLPVGDYDTAFSLTLFIGGGAFAQASPRDAALSFVNSWKH